jgi:hypothetical protein
LATAEVDWRRVAWAGGILVEDEVAAVSPGPGDLDLPLMDIGSDFGRLRAAMLGFAARDQRPFTSLELGEQVIHLSRTLDMGRLELAKLVGVFSSTREAELQGSNDATDWIRHNARLSRSEADQLRVVGEQISELPQGSVALSEGRVGFGHLVHMARNSAFIEKSGTGHFDEALLLDRAEDESVSRFFHTCMNARHVQDPEGCLAAEVDAVEKRELTINPRDDGTTWINVCLDSAAAAMTQSVLEQMSVRLGPDDYRTKARRMADALVEVTQAPLNEVEGAHTVGRRVHLNVSCTLESLLRLPGAPGAAIEFGQPISSDMLGRLACDATICKILLDKNLTPVAVGHMKRTLSKKERRALDVRDRHCQYPGCCRPASRCVPHHMVWYSRGGPTKLSNVLLCAVHHWRVHEGGWTLFKGQDGAFHVIPPHFRQKRWGLGAPILA